MEAGSKLCARTLLLDLRNGMTLAGVMEKYSLSLAAAQMICRKLVDEKLVNPEILYGRARPVEDSRDSAKQRRLARVSPDQFLEIYDVENPDNRGRVTDMTETGVGVLGLRAEVNEYKTLVIPPHDSYLTGKFVFRARCCWTRIHEENHESVAGFEITEVTEGYFLDFVKLMGGLTFVR
ncbi:MAG TPA: hypothetical protein VK463_10340 [Desulfomonilaceae bacterium]|nr:hypothetical protein [Desulfomonilaceae bacterium]